MSREEFEASLSGGAARRPIQDATTMQVDPVGSPQSESPLGMRAKSELGGQEPAALPSFMPPGNRTSAGSNAVPRNDVKRERGGTAVRSRLPPPMLPATVGFGLELPYPGATKSAASDLPSPRKDFPPVRALPPAAMRTANASLLKQVTGK